MVLVAVDDQVVFDVDGLGFDLIDVEEGVGLSVGRGLGGVAVVAVVVLGDFHVGPGSGALAEREDGRRGLKVRLG